MLTGLDPSKRLKVFAVLDQFVGEDVSSLPLSEQTKLNDLVFAISDAMVIRSDSDRFKMIPTSKIEDIEEVLDAIPNIIRETNHEIQKINQAASDIYRLNQIDGVTVEGGKATCMSLDLIGDAVAAIQMTLSEVKECEREVSSTLSTLRL